MALRVRSINNLFKLWCIAGSGGLEIWVSSTRFQKSDIGWPQQPPIEKVLKFNMIFHDSTKIKIISKHQNELEFKNLDDSEVLSSDFPDFTLQPRWPLQPQQPLWPQWPLQPHFIKKLLILMILSPLAPTWPIMVSFSGLDHKKSKFSLISEPFLSEAVEASQCYFFENWLMKLKFPNLMNLLGTINQ